jgi:hypothetical protein
MIRWQQGVIVLAAMLLTACGKSKTADSEQPVAEDDVAARRGLWVSADRKDYHGRWGWVLTQQVPDQAQQMMVFRDLCMAVIEITAEEGQTPSAKVVATMPGGAPIEVSGVVIDGAKISLQLVMSGEPMSFAGSLDSGLVRGSLINPKTGPIPSALVPTNETAYEGWEFQPVSGGFDLMMKGSQEKEQPQAMYQVAQALRGSPLSLEVFQGLLSRLQQFPNVDEAMLREMIEKYEDSAQLWGPEMVARTRIVSAIAVTQARRYHKVALELLDQAEKTGGEFLVPMAETLKQARAAALIDQNLDVLRSGSAEEQAAAFTELQSRDPRRRFDPEILAALGHYAAKTKQNELAKQLLADVVALPLHEAIWMQSQQGKPPGDPTPREELLSLWEDEHGGVDGFQEFLETTYQQRVQEAISSSVQGGAAPVADAERQKTVLVEMFTGSACGPCVGADFALAAVEQTYPTQNVVVLRYHQHIPAPCPLANQDSEDRAVYYEVDSTPTVVINGAKQPPMGGPIAVLSVAYPVYRELIDQQLKQASDYSLALTAEMKDDVLHVTALADEIPEDQRADLRLRVAVAENNVVWTGPNGLRERTHVVREMLGGAKGIGPRGGKLTNSFEIPIAELKTRLSEYLSQFEVGRDIEFPTKPLGLQGLSVVAWIQHEPTKEVLQTVLVNVSGGTASAAPSSTPTTNVPATDPAAPAAPATEPPATESSPESPAPAAEKPAPEPSTPEPSTPEPSANEPPAADASPKPSDTPAEPSPPAGESSASSTRGSSSAPSVRQMTEPFADVSARAASRDDRFSGQPDCCRTSLAG